MRTEQSGRYISLSGEKHDQCCWVRALGEMNPVARFVAGAAFVFSLFFSAVEGLAQTGCVTDACHGGFMEKTATHPSEMACTDCHREVPENHAQGEAKTMLVEEMCVSCHEETLAQRILHSPVTKTSCQLCHNPHGAMDNMLLPKSYSTEQFVDYTNESFSLCFSCHKRDLLMFPDTSYSTGFRNGIRNLHYLHVNKANRGRSCKLCHGIHGGEQEKMMAETVLFGNWLMPINFRKTDTGGSCAPGCHETQQYDRNARGVVVEKKQEAQQGNK